MPKPDYSKLTPEERQARQAAHAERVAERQAALRRAAERQQEVIRHENDGKPAGPSGSDLVVNHGSRPVDASGNDGDRVVSGDGSDQSPHLPVGGSGGVAGPERAGSTGESVSDEDEITIGCEIEYNPYINTVGSQDSTTLTHLSYGEKRDILSLIDKGYAIRNILKKLKINLRIYYRTLSEDRDFRDSVNVFTFAQRDESQHILYRKAMGIAGDGPDAKPSYDLADPEYAVKFIDVFNKSQNFSFNRKIANRELKIKEHIARMEDQKNKPVKPAWNALDKEEWNEYDTIAEMMMNGEHITGVQAQRYCQLAGKLARATEVKRREQAGGISKVAEALRAIDAVGRAIDGPNED